MNRQTVLIVEDEQKLASLLEDYLKQAGFGVSVVNNGRGVVDLVRRDRPEVILLDVMLPGKDGLTICREIRSFSRVPILMITAKVEEIDVLLGLELGADDYICKPFSPREVVARVKAVLRRAGQEPMAAELKAGPLVLSQATRKVTLGGKELHLTPSEFELLKVLISRPSQVFTRSELVCHLQGFEFEGYERTIDSHIKNLRKKMADQEAAPNLIRTIYGVGYSFDPSAGRG